MDVIRNDVAVADIYRMRSFNDLPPSHQTGARVLFKAFELLKENSGEMPIRELLSRIPEELELTEWELERYEKTGNIRWQSIFHFMSIDCVKAGFLRKQHGVWFLTSEGEAIMKKGPAEFLQTAASKYRDWVAENKEEAIDEFEELAKDSDDINQAIQVNLEKLEEEALHGIKESIKALNPYSFQDLVAALLRGMGYHTAFISPKGRDGGVDIIAYQDPLGIKTPRIKVQVKHKPEQAIPVDDIRSLLGLLNRESEIGIFVTSGRFTSEAERFGRASSSHVNLIDADTFIDLWKEYYIKLSDSDKQRLALRPIYFFDPV